MKSEQHQRPRLFRRLTLYTSLLGILFISLFFATTYVAQEHMEIISLHHWLDAEANMLENEYRQTQSFSYRPNPAEFDIYRSNSGVPAWLSSYTKPGFFEHQLGPEDKHFLIRQDPSGNGLLYIVFKDNADDYLDPYEEKLHIASLITGTAVLLLMITYGAYLVRQFAWPLQQLGRKIQQMPPDQPDFGAESPYEEIYRIEQALSDSKRQIAGYFRREQEFSRFAAHEIRTPLMVLQGSADLINRCISDDQPGYKAAIRIAQAAQDIRLLTDTFLLLGLDHIDSQHYDRVNLSVQLHQQIAEAAKLQPAPCLLSEPTAEHCTGQSLFKTNIPDELYICAPQSFVLIMLNNLLRNALSYSNGIIEVTCTQARLTVTNPTSDLPDHSPNKEKGKHNQDKHYGYGLTIVERICERLNWQLTVERHANGGQFSVSVDMSSSLSDATNK